MPPLITRYAGAAPLATLKRMVAIVMTSYELSDVIDRAGQIAATATEKNDVAIAYAIMGWLRMHTRFVQAPMNVQLLKVPSKMLLLIDQDGVVGADCVSVAMLAASLGMAVSIPARFLAEGYQTANNLTHVYAQLHTPLGWLTLDTQRPGDAPPVQPIERVAATIP